MEQKSARILIIDDELDMLKVLRLVLEQAGYEVLSASDGNNGIAKAQKESPDLIVLDVRMPGIDGWSACRALKACKETSGIPVLMCTSRSRPSDINEGFKAGASDYILKPFESQNVLKKIESVLSRKS